MSKKKMRRQQNGVSVGAPFSSEVAGEKNVSQESFSYEREKTCAPEEKSAAGESAVEKIDYTPAENTETGFSETVLPTENSAVCYADGEEKKSRGKFVALLTGRFPRVFAFFYRNWAFFLAPLIVFAIYMIQLAVSEVYPFGPNNVVASYDLSAQICPFIEHFFDVMDGKSSLFYSYAIAGGADVFGSVAYFFISPFSFIYLLFGDGNVYNACGIVMALKLASIAFAGTWFVKKLFKNIPDYLCVAIGVVYTYCGYVFVASTYVNWIDLLVYMPFCATAFAHFVRTEKFLPFALLMACCIYTSFSIACFSMFTVFPALIVYALICVDKEKRNRFISYLCLSFVVAVLVSLPLLVPALMAYLRSGRSGGLFDEFWYGFGGEGQDFFLLDSFIKRSGEAWYKKFSYIFSDSVFLALTVVYFVKSRLKTRMSKFMLVAGIFTLVPVLSDEAMLLMNMGSYMQYSLRFGFLNALYFLGGACLCLQGVNFAPETSFDGSSLKKKGREGNILFFAVVAAVCGSLIACFVGGDNYLNIWENIFTNSEWISNAKGFSASYAHSLGGLQVTLVFFVVVAFVVALGALMVRNKEIGARVMAVILIAVVGVQVLFYNEQLVVGNTSTHYNVSHYQNLMDDINARDDGYFRVKDYEEKVTANIPFTGNSNSFSVFSSVIDADNFEIYTLFGYYGNGKNSLKSRGGNAFGDAFLGYKYFFSSAKDAEGGLWSTVNNLQYTKPVVDEEGDQITSGPFTMFENTAVFPMGYTVSSGEFRFEEANTSGNRSKNQIALYEYLKGEDVTATSVSTTMTVNLAQELWQRAADVKVGAGRIDAAVTAEEGEYLFMPFMATKGYSVIVNGKAAELCDNDLHFICVKLEAGENVVELVYSSPYVRYAGFGLGAAVLGLLIVAFVVGKTKFMEKFSPVIATAGKLLALALVAFFMVFPLLVTLWKLLAAGYTKFFAKPSETGGIAGFFRRR